MLYPRLVNHVRSQSVGKENLGHTMSRKQANICLEDNYSGSQERNQKAGDHKKCRLDIV
jgi:hypothetical protein